jgi:putative transposase
MPRWRLFYHLVWATRNRAPLLDAVATRTVERSIRATCHEHRAVVHAVGIMPDHVHVALSIPPSVAISTFVGRVKGSASHLLNHANGTSNDRSFAWQAEYGTVSFGEKNLPDVVAYVENQEIRHAQDHLWKSLESFEVRPQPPSGGFVGSARDRQPRAAANPPEHA